MLILIIVIIIIIVIIVCVVKYKESFTNVPVILHISCYGYGNMGDNMYKEVFNKFIPEYKIISISDHSLFVDRKHQIIRNIPNLICLLNWPYCRCYWFHIIIHI